MLTCNRKYMQLYINVSKIFAPLTNNYYIYGEKLFYFWLDSFLNVYFWESKNLCTMRNLSLQMTLSARFEWKAALKWTWQCFSMWFVSENKLTSNKRMGFWTHFDIIQEAFSYKTTASDTVWCPESWIFMFVAFGIWKWALGQLITMRFQVFIKMRMILHWLALASAGCRADTVRATRLCSTSTGYMWSLLLLQVLDASLILFYR